MIKVPHFLGLSNEGVLCQHLFFSNSDLWNMKHSSFSRVLSINGNVLKNKDRSVSCLYAEVVICFI